MSEFKKLNPLMSCCGVVGAHGFNLKVDTGEIDNRFGWERKIYRVPTAEDIAARVADVAAEQVREIWWPRNCAIIFLADGQEVAIEAAEKQGFKKIQTFYNPNSGNNVHIMTRIEWKDEDEYKASETYARRKEEDGDEEEDDE